MAAVGGWSAALSSVPGWPTSTFSPAPTSRPNRLPPPKITNSSRFSSSRPPTGAHSVVWRGRAAGAGPAAHRGLLGRLLLAGRLRDVLVGRPHGRTGRRFHDAVAPGPTLRAGAEKPGYPGHPRVGRLEGRAGR